MRTLLLPFPPSSLGKRYLSYSFGVSSLWSSLTETSPTCIMKSARSLGDKRVGRVGSTCRKLRKNGHVWSEKNGLASGEIFRRGCQDQGTAWWRRCECHCRGDQTCSQHQHGTKRSVKIPSGSKSAMLSGSRGDGSVPGTGWGTSGKLQQGGLRHRRNERSLSCVSVTLELMTLWWNYIFMYIYIVEYMYVWNVRDGVNGVSRMWEYMVGCFTIQSSILKVWGLFKLLLFLYVIQQAECLRLNQARGKMLV